MNPDKIFIGGAGHVIALCRNSGEILWERELNPRFFKSANDFVSLLETKKGLLAFSYGTLYRIEPSTGAIIWQKHIKQLKYSVGIISTDYQVSFAAEVASGSDGGDGGGGD
ncbi:MAG: hypothetical protein ACFCU3_04470 [Verrucomicrobiales bacterium]